MTGFVSVRLWKTLITPFFWPTKIRPSDANCSTVGLVSPLSTTESRKPVGSVEAPAGPGPTCDISAAISTIAAAMLILPRPRVAFLRRNMSPHFPALRPLRALPLCQLCSCSAVDLMLARLVWMPRRCWVGRRKMTFMVFCTQAPLAAGRTCMWCVSRVPSVSGVTV